MIACLDLAEDRSPLRHCADYAVKSTVGSLVVASGGKWVDADSFVSALMGLDLKRG